MRWIQFFKERVQSLTNAVSRFPLSVIFLVIATSILSLNIQTEEFDYYELMIASFVGALAAAVAQMAYERFFYPKSKLRMIVHLPALLLAIIYYFTIQIEPDVFSFEVMIRTTVLSFALFIAFVWSPSIRNRLTFSDSFTATFKALFTTLLFSVVLGAGITSILSAVNVLLFTVDYRVFMHAANIVASLFAPVFFMSDIPHYPVSSEKDSIKEDFSPEVKTAISVPKTMEVLLSYIIIPITMIFTVILTLYILINIGRDFWVDNLLEPMLVSYSIIVILVMLLIGRLENKIASSFRLVFPKILFFIVLLQTVASVIQISDKGLTIGRYYVILFGLFAIIASVIFSIWPKQKNGLVAVVLIAFSVISIVPPVDAFTVSKNGQIAFLRTVLSNNDMLAQNTVVPKNDVPENEQRKIVETINDLERNGYIEEVAFLPEDFQSSVDFEETFGFDQYGHTTEENNYYYFEWANETALDISNYQSMLKMQVDTMTQGANTETIQMIEIEGSMYQLELAEENNTVFLSLNDETGQELLSSNISAAADELKQSTSGISTNLTLEQALFEEENDEAVLDILVTQLDINSNGEVFIELFAFVTVK
ncbi:DUF4153 domain-containing protein [Desemzia sp. RIT804]|uniref:DUF4153 domain-containing protein n=1 Tax=Desemzia sp. RIT 804 TaxID=2810209 RepID=UPI00194E4645|nr:DUF4153 domain-containing protein [Desemzia sp. RIT 804]MBM6615533.1 DUF4153 domain-containing protein [Desemzia sp. RIT 804]